MADLLEEQREQLRDGSKLVSIPWKGPSEQLHLALQVCNLPCSKRLLACIRLIHLIHAQVVYCINLPDLLKHWTLQALQGVAAAGHRLRFAADLQACAEQAMLDKLHTVGIDELAQLLLWAHSVAFERLQSKLVPLAVTLSPLPSLQETFGEQQPVFALVQLLRTQLDRAKAAPENLPAQILSLTRSLGQ